MFMHRIKFENMLSFGPDSQELDLMPRNVLIGSNRSGKSNRIEMIGLLRAAPGNIMAPIREGGGSDNRIWRGESRGKEARVEAVVEEPFVHLDQKLFRYSLAFGPFYLRSPSFEEEIEKVGRTEDEEDDSEPYRKRRSGNVTLACRDESGKRHQRERQPTDIRPDASILSHRKDPVRYREVTSVGILRTGMHLYRPRSFGRNTPPRFPQQADLPNNSPMEDGRNLGMVLNRLASDSGARRNLLTELQSSTTG